MARCRATRNSISGRRQTKVIWRMQLKFKPISGNSPFVVALIEKLRQPGVEVGFLFRKVRDSVLDLPNGTQEPYTYGSLPGREELYFNPPVK